MEITVGDDFLGIFDKQSFINVVSILSCCGYIGAFTFENALL
jgi:hypothetical protein